MPATYEIDVAQSLILSMVTGVVSAAEMEAHQAAIAADPRFSPTFDTLMEFGPDSLFNGTGGDIQRLSQSNPYGRGTRRAYVVANDLHFGLSRMAQEYSDMTGTQVELFRDRQAAMAWLLAGRANK